MKTIPIALSNHLSGRLTTLATCWKVTCQDSTVYGFTDHDVDLVVAGVTYSASSGSMGSALSSAANTNAGNTEIIGLLDGMSLTETDLLSGKYNYASIRVFVCNWADTSMGVVPLMRGTLGQVTLEHGQFKVELNSMVDELQQTVGKLYSYDCRANFGDYPYEIKGAKCGVNRNSYEVTGSATEDGNQNTFVDNSRSEIDDYFRYGTLTFTSGLNNGIMAEVKKFQSGRFYLSFDMPNLISLGDSYTAIPGCAHVPTACKYYNNYNNYRGEPDVPGIDRLLNYPPDYPETSMGSGNATDL